MCTCAPRLRVVGGAGDGGGGTVFLGMPRKRRAGESERGCASESALKHVCAPKYVCIQYAKAEAGNACASNIPVTRRGDSIFIITVVIIIDVVFVIVVLLLLLL
jgi:hypothetical protein